MAMPSWGPTNNYSALLETHKDCNSCYCCAFPLPCRSGCQGSAWGGGGVLQVGLRLAHDSVSFVTVFAINSAFCLAIYGVSLYCCFLLR